MATFGHLALFFFFNELCEQIKLNFELFKSGQKKKEKRKRETNKQVTKKTKQKSVNSKL